VFGSIVPASPASLNATLLTPNSFVMNVGSLMVERNYALQSTTNLASAVWSTETNFVVTRTTAVFTNATANASQKFYRIVGH